MNLRHKLFIVVVTIYLIAPDAGEAGQVGPKSWRYSDSLVHYVDFFQATKGMERLLAAMDENGIGDAMICGSPLMKTWDEHAPRRPRYSQGDDAPMYYYSATDIIVARAVLSLDSAQQERFHPFICGFNPTDRNGAEHVGRMLEWYPGLWQGIGEVLTRHDDLTALTQGNPPRADSKSMDRIYILAAQNDLPVMLHSNATSVRERDLIYLDELKSALREHPETRFIWAHAGTSAAINRRIHLAGLLPALEDLLGEFKNLWIDLSWSVRERYLRTKEGEPDQGWISLVCRYPERFMLGSDALGRFGWIGKKFKGFEPFLAALPPEVAHRVARTNFLEVLPATHRTRLRAGQGD